MMDDPPQFVSSSSYPQHGVSEDGSCWNARAFQRSMRSGPYAQSPSGAAEIRIWVMSHRPSYRKA
jgi:hypothetical protein